MVTNEVLPVYSTEIDLLSVAVQTIQSGIVNSFPFVNQLFFVTGSVQKFTIQHHWHLVDI